MGQVTGDGGVSRGWRGGEDATGGRRDSLRGGRVDVTYTWLGDSSRTTAEWDVGIAFGGNGKFNVVDGECTDTRNGGNSLRERGSAR